MPNETDIKIPINKEAYENYYPPKVMGQSCKLEGIQEAQCVPVEMIKQVTPFCNDYIYPSVCVPVFQVSISFLKNLYSSCGQIQLYIKRIS